MHIYLLRHGDAVAATENPKRPLSEKGLRDVDRTAHLALARNVQVSAIYHSGILRAVETAEVLAKVLAPALRMQVLSGLLPEDDPATVKAELDLINDPVALVGHLPHLNRLAALLTTGDPKRAVIGFFPAMMVCFERENQRWKIAWTSTEPTV